MSTLILLLAAASVCDCGLTCNTTLTFVSLAPKVAERARALFGLGVLGEAGVADCADNVSEPVLLGPRLCSRLALPGRIVKGLLGEAVLAKSEPAANVWCFCPDLAPDMVKYASKLQHRHLRV